MQHGPDVKIDFGRPFLWRLELPNTWGYIVLRGSDYEPYRADASCGSSGFRERGRLGSNSPDLPRLNLGVSAILRRPNRPHPQTVAMYLEIYVGQIDHTRTSPRNSFPRRYPTACFRAYLRSILWGFWHSLSGIEFPDVRP